MALECTNLLKILEQYCDAEGYKYDSGTYAYGTFTTFRDGTVSIGCYKFKNKDHKKMTKAVAKACNILENKVTIQTDLKRDDKQVQCKDIDKKNGITELQYIDGVCAPSKCLTPRWELSGNGKRAKCIEQECDFKHGTGNWERNDDTWECKLTACDTAKGWKMNDDQTACIEMLDKCTPEQKAQLPNATKTGIKKGTETCIAQECECGYDLQDGKCDNKWSLDKQCTNDTKPKLPKNAKSAKMTCNAKGKATCEITSCQDGYDHNTEKNKCTKPGEPDTDDGDDQTQQNEPRLSESDSQAKVDELRDNAQAMRDKEQSTANKLLGAAGIGATGIGGMQMASAMAEQSADEDAETAMRAYLATFHCNYGGGQNIPGGKTNVELPGGNELIDLYSEYVNLANDLKVRKTALDMRPGIESESILDAATSGLYDDVAIGKTSGAYTSLARALMDPNGADAAAWAQQKAETADKKKTGMITAGIGAAGSLVGNLAINSGKDKQNKLDEILNKYDKKKQLLDDLQSDVAAIPPQTAPCPDGTTGTAQLDCTCTDPTKIYNPNANTCDECTGGQTVQNGECKCPDDKPLWDNRISRCVAESTTCTPKCTPTEGSHLVVLQDCSCTCIDGYTYENGTCTCTGENKKIANDGTCQTISPQQVITTTTITIDKATLPAASLFQIGSDKLVDDAKTALSKFINGLSDAGYTDCIITVNGYTDPVGNNTSNLKLSTNRANAVKQHIDDLGNSVIKSVTAVGHGEENCTCGAGKSSAGGQLNGQIDYNALDYRACKGQKDSTKLLGSTRYAPCRRVEISAECTKTTTTSQ
ncbi:MAG: OmpA family protein [Alphaproteobacteria bacterium]|nr:OmpA family protein [Alphaproteobacteria bacterium]